MSEGLGSHVITHKEETPRNLGAPSAKKAPPAALPYRMIPKKLQSFWKKIMRNKRDAHGTPALPAIDTQSQRLVLGARASGNFVALDSDV